MSAVTDDLDETLAAVDDGQVGAAERLMPLVYEELRARARQIMVNERVDHTLTPTALVHDAYVKLVGTNRGWQCRTHFLNAAAQAMRRLLVDHSRQKGAVKHGAEWKRTPIDSVDVAFASSEFDWVGIDAALERFRSVDERAHRVVMLRFFAGRSEEEIAELLKLSVRQVRREWRTARLWLRRSMDEGDTNG